MINIMLSADKKRSDNNVNDIYHKAWCLWLLQEHNLIEAQAVG